MNTTIPSAAMLLFISGALSACTDGVGHASAAVGEPAATTKAVAAEAQMHDDQADAVVEGNWPAVLVHKSPSCGCCALWVEHLEAAGFNVEVRNHHDLNPIKLSLGIPYGKGSCHTAEVGGYFVEGHVPADDIKRMLSERIDAKGLVLPGMPMGSPGMEMPDGRTQAYTVEQVNLDGSTTAYAQH